MKAPTLADFLGVSSEQTLDDRAVQLEDITDAKQFAEAVLSSREFRSYIVSSLVLCQLPAAVITRLMDYAWGKPTERIEHTGKDGQPIETITEVRRVIVRVHDVIDDEQDTKTRTITH